MEQLANYGDTRQLARCVYCGGKTETRDHVPSKVLLDEPYPSNLPRVPACRHCNESFSMDEEYIACLIECVLIGSANVDHIERHKVRRILSKKPALAARLRQSRRVIDGDIFFNAEESKIMCMLCLRYPETIRSLTWLRKSRELHPHGSRNNQRHKRSFIGNEDMARSP